MKRSDISDLEILQICYEGKDTPDIVLSNKYPVKVIMAKLEQLYDKGYLECGVSLRTAWLTDKGEEYLQGLKKIEEKTKIMKSQKQQQGRRENEKRKDN